MLLELIYSNFFPIYQEPFLTCFSIRGCKSLTLMSLIISASSNIKHFWHICTSLVISILNRVNIFKSLYLETLTLARIMLVECSRTNSEMICSRSFLLKEIFLFLLLGENLFRHFLHLKRPSFNCQKLVLA